MILSMTGYGAAEQATDGVAFALELRSVNNRYFKASVKLPERLSMMEGEVEKLLRAGLVRGSVTYTLRLRDTSPQAAQEINVAALQSYLQQLSHVQRDDQARIDLAALVMLPGVCQPPEVDEAQRQREWEIVKSLTETAIERVNDMRRAEGRALRDDLLNQCKQIRHHLKLIGERAPAVVEEYFQRLLTRANELLNNSKLQLELDDVRREVAIYAERCDINEEVSRLTSHLEQFERLCDSNEVAGRKLEFLAQETLREANTIGSKSNDTLIAHSVVEIKGAIDRLKEQVLNVA